MHKFERIDRSTCIGAARMACRYCHGDGMRGVRYGADRFVPCRCVLRAIFRACLRRYLLCTHTLALGNNHCTLDRYASHPVADRGIYGFKHVEYMADFVRLGDQGLPDSLQRAIFRLHFLRGADHKFCCAQLHLDRGTFFTKVYVIEQQLGRVYAETEPYGLWPLDEYFCGKDGRDRPLPDPVPQSARELRHQRRQGGRGRLPFEAPRPRDRAAENPARLAGRRPQLQPEHTQRGVFPKIPDYRRPLPFAQSA